MEIEEFLKRYKILRQRYEVERVILEETLRKDIQEMENLFSKDYVEKFARFKVGNFIKYYITIKIEKIEAKIFFSKPSIYYYGYKHVLDKNGEVVKSKNSRMYCFEDRENLIKIN